MIALRGEAVAIAGDDVLNLVMDNAAWVEAEDLLNQSLHEMLAYLGQCSADNRAPKNGTMRALLFGATRRNHGALTVDQCGDLLVRFPDVFEPLCKAISGSMRWNEDAEPGEAEARLTEGAHGTGTQHSPITTKPVGGQTTSGGKPRKPR